MVEYASAVHTTDSTELFTWTWWMVRGKMKGYLRASFWKVYSEFFVSEKLMRKWGRKVPTMDVVVESIVEVVGGDERF
ncbi:hypothetical protein Tco_1211289 [Tanacetum coccineum]